MSQPAGVLITNARPWSDGAPVAGATAIALGGDRILACGAERDLSAWVGPATRRIDARGATVTPGIWDAHVHLLPWARSRTELDLAGSASPHEVASRLARHLERHPGAGAIVGRGWDSNDWREPPHRALLDAVSKARPVMLHSHDFHALWVNGAALAFSGVSRATPDPPGGLIERDHAGEPTGVVRENGVRSFRTLEAEAAAATGDPLELLADAAAALHAFGITAVHDFERGEAAFALMERFARGTPAPGGRDMRDPAAERARRVRVLQCVDPDDLERVAAMGLRSGQGDDRFRVGGVKLFADGTLGSRTAALLEPYEGTASRGLEVLSPADLDERMARARARRFALAVHAVGDGACRNALDAFERRRAKDAGGEPPGLADRIEHIQLLAPADAPRFAALEVAASMQPLHCTADAPLAIRHWGGRCRSSYPWRALLDAGAALAFGSDAPVEPPDTGATLAAARTRVAADGRPFEAAQCITLDEALMAYTAAAARLAGAWPRLGSLRAGSLADLVVWDRDLHATPPGRLHEARPSCTFADGLLVHAQQEADARPGHFRP